MPTHDWTRVTAGTLHDFHGGWIIELRKALNKGLLPPDYYAQTEQVAGNFGPDVLTHGGIAVAEAPPKVRFTTALEMDYYVLKQRTLVIRHSSDDRIIALIEILSPGNKGSRNAFRTFVDKALSALARGYHLLLLDLHPPGRRDPHGIHGAILDEIGDDTYTAPADKPLTLAAYSAGDIKTAYVEPVAIGDTVPDMPLFLEPETYVSVPLEATYQEACAGVPYRWRTVLEGPTS
jgi:hypothetical protein